jgi:hypothetical protein
VALPSSLRKTPFARLFCRVPSRALPRCRSARLVLRWARCLAAVLPEQTATTAGRALAVVAAAMAPRLWPGPSLDPRGTGKREGGWGVWGAGNWGLWFPPPRPSRLAVARLFEAAVPTRGRPLTGSSRVTDDYWPFTGALAAQAGVDQLPGHHPTPRADAPLQRPQLASREAPRVLPVQPLQQRLGSRFRVSLEPQQDFRPDALEGVLPGPPTAGLGRLLTMCRAGFPLPP